MIRIPCGRAIAGLALATALAAPAASADGGRPAAGAASPRLGVLCFLSYQGSERPAFDAAAVHAGSWDRITDVLRERGVDVISRQDLDGSLRAWGVRTGLAISVGFLTSLAVDHQLDGVLVCDLIFYPDRVMLCERSVDTAGGQIDWADVEELRLPLEHSAEGVPEIGRWLDAAERAGRVLATRWSARPARNDGPANLFLLPVRTTGLVPATGSMVMACLLATLIQSPWRIEDPGVTCSRLREAGHDPAFLDGHARLILAGEGLGSKLLISAIVAEGDDGPSEGALFQVGDLTVSPGTLPAAALSVRLVDGESGCVSFAATEVLEPPAARGLFGMAKNEFITERVRAAADQILRAARKKG